MSDRTPTDDRSIEDKPTNTDADSAEAESADSRRTVLKATGLLAALGLSGVASSGTAAAQTDHDHWGESWSGAAGSNYGLEVIEESTEGFSYGVRGISDADQGRGVYGLATADSGETYGLWGRAYSTEGRGLSGTVTATTGPTIGVFGSVESDQGEGVLGLATSTTGNTVGVTGRSSSSSGIGVLARGDTGLKAASTTGGYGLLTHDDARINGSLHVPADHTGLGTTNPVTWLDVTADVTGTTTDPENHVATVENTDSSTNADVLSLKVNQNEPGIDNNYITFFNDTNDEVGRVEGNGTGGVVYETTGADYAEYLPRLDPEETIEPMEVVGVVGGQVTRDIADADAERAMVVSDRTAVLGNAPETAERERHETVAFVGQVPAKVRGAVETGELIVPSGRADGTGVAVAPREYDHAEDGPIVGQAWETAEADSEDVTEVTVAVGLDNTDAVAARLAEHRERLEEHRRRNEHQQDAIEALQEELDRQRIHAEQQEARVEQQAAAIAKLQEEAHDRDGKIASTWSRVKRALGALAGRWRTVTGSTT